MCRVKIRNDQHFEVRTTKYNFGVEKSVTLPNNDNFDINVLHGEWDMNAQ